MIWRKTANVITLRLTVAHMKWARWSAVEGGGTTVREARADACERGCDAGCETLRGAGRETAGGLAVFDLHCDTVDALGMRTWEPYASEPPAAGARPDDDLARNAGAVSLEGIGRTGAAWAQCFAVWVPDLYRRRDAQAFYRQAADYFHAQVRAHAGCVAQVRDARDVDAVLASGRVAALLTLENASVLGHSVREVEALVADGVKMATLTWNGRNAIGSGCETADGLTMFGREAVRALEDVRIVVDASHLNPPSFADLLDVARRPFACSHSNARAVCGHPRNLTDEQFRAVRDSGGVVGLTPCRSFVTDRAAGAPGGPDDVTFDELARHVEHFLDLGGERVVCLGSDFDGCTTPGWLRGCEDVPGFARLLCARFGEQLTRRLLFENARDFMVRNETA